MNTFSCKALRKMWDAADKEERDNILFQLAMDNAVGINKLHKRKRLDTTVSGIGGIFGGILAMVGRWIFFRNA